MSETRSESEYAKKVRAGQMYGPMRKWDNHEQFTRECEDVKRWVSRIRYSLGKDGQNEAVTLEDIRAAKDRAKLAA